MGLHYTGLTVAIQKATMPANYTDYQNYVDGYHQGLATRADTGGPPYNLEPLPAHTDDNYKNYRDTRWGISSRQ